MVDFYIEDEIKLDRSIMGSFGNFKTSKSFEVFYMMTSLNISKIDRLQEASSVLSFSQIDFDAVVQRDIDYERVDSIFDQYLDKSSDKVVFFPPLLVTLMVVENGQPIDKYREISDEVIDKAGRKFLEKMWDKKIKLTLPLSDNLTDQKIEVQGQDVHYIHYAGKIEYNDDFVKLIVIDGQHRLKALQKLREKNPTLESINIPLCIFFSSKAKFDNDENITQDMRELFVTINNTAKKVSGHFITLLKDNSLSSLAVREFANKLKGVDASFANTKLYYLEWNQRQDSRAYQVNGKAAVSTVSIIAEALKTYAFDEKNGLTQNILNLSEVKEELATGLDYREIFENQFSLNQTEILKRQINQYIVPSLEILFLESLPYNTIITAVNSAINDLNKKIESNVTGARDYKENVLLEFRSLNNYDSDTRRAFDKEFNLCIQYDDYWDYFKNNIFQQAYIKVWIDLYRLLEFEPQSVASALSTSMNAICFNKEKSYFSPIREYIQSVLYKGKTMVVNNATKEHISYLILSSFLNETCRKAFVSKIGNPEEVESKLLDIARNSYDKYFEIFLNKNIASLKSNYMYEGYLSKDEKKTLADLDMKAKSGTNEDKDAFKAELTRVIEKDKQIAMQILSNILEIS